MVIENTDQRSKDYSDIKDTFRPGHADYTYEQKYGVRDYRGGGRSSARETAMRVAAGAIAKKWLKQTYGTQIEAYVAQIGPIKAEKIDLAFKETNPLFCPDPEALPQMEAYLTELKKTGDSIGARVNLVATKMPLGLGEPVFDRLDADLAKALMSINAVKGVEIGDGFAVVAQKGSQHRDEMTPEGFLSNHAGGILGGISSGQDLLASVALKPTSSIRIPGRSILRDGTAHEMITKGRHDPCVGIRAVPIVEAMAALVLMDHALRHRAQNLDITPPVKPL